MKKFVFEFKNNKFQFECAECHNLAEIQFPNLLDEIGERLPTYKIISEACRCGCSEGERSDSWIRAACKQWEWMRSKEASEC